MLLGVQPVQGGKPVRSSSEFDETSDWVPEIEDDGIEHAGIEHAGSEQLHACTNMGSEQLHAGRNMGSEQLHDQS